MCVEIEQIQKFGAAHAQAPCRHGSTGAAETRFAIAVHEKHAHQPDPAEVPQDEARLRLAHDEE